MENDALDDMSARPAPPPMISVADAAAPAAERQRRGPALGHVLSLVVGLTGIAALAASAWVYAETRREILRVSTEIAQLHLSLELYTREQASAAIETDSLLDLSNRLAVLEESWRGPAASAPASAPVAATAPAGAASDGDCLPTGTRFMVAAGDTYPVCGTTGEVAIGAVDDGFISLADGSVIAQGGTVALTGTSCMIGLLPSDGGALSGFAEIRVTC